MSEIETVRMQFEHELESGRFPQARDCLRALWHLQSSPTTAAYILSMRPRLGSLPGVRKCRVAVLRSFTVEPVIPLLEAEAFLHGLDLEIQVGDFNAYAQEILDPASRLYAFAPDLVLLAVQTRDIAPALWEGFSQLRGEEAGQVAAQVLDQMYSWWNLFRARCGARLVVHNFEEPPAPAAGILDSQLPEAQIGTIRRMNADLARMARRFAGVHILDYVGLVGRHGAVRWFDRMKWASVRLPVAAGCLQYLAHEWLRYVYASAGVVRKVLVADLDNTLWGGVAGEDGLTGIQLGSHYPAAGYREMQRAMLDLYERGVLLAVNSKNNEADVVHIIDEHPGMLLRSRHFAALRINWQDKAQNLREIAAELNVGIDSLVFVDDNPAERQQIRMELPEVEVIELPRDPMGYAAALRESPVFDRLALTEDDLTRNQQYREQRSRLELARTTSSLEEFYRSLKQVVTIASLRPETLARAAQLAQKTNQFNLTGRRFTEEQLRDLSQRRGWNVYTVQVEDRFGDNGIVGLVVTDSGESCCRVENLVLSCRVIGRTIESAILAFLAQECRREGAIELRGEFIQTRKNAPAGSFFESHKFTLLSAEGDATRWSYLLADGGLSCPDWIDLRISGERALAAYAAL